MRIASSLKRSKQYTNKRQDIEMITKTTKESKRSITMKSARNSANDDGACRLLYVCVSVWKCSGYFYCLQTMQLFVYTLIVSRIMVHRSCEMHWYNQNAPNMCVCMNVNNVQASYTYVSVTDDNWIQRLLSVAHVIEKQKIQNIGNTANKSKSSHGFGWVPNFAHEYTFWAIHFFFQSELFVRLFDFNWYHLCHHATVIVITRSVFFFIPIVS